MSWSYSGDPRDSVLDQARFLAQLTDDTNQRVTNEELTWLLSENGDDPYAAAAAAASRVAAQYADQADKSVGDLSISYSQRASQFAELAGALEKEKKSNAAFRVAPYAGGISVTDKDAERTDTTRSSPFAWIGMHDNPPVTYGSTST